MVNRNKQIKYYTSLLKENEYLLIKSSDSFFKSHYLGSPLNVLTNFSGTEGEAIIDKTGKIVLFVDTRYHILADKQVFDDIEVCKLDLSETFFDGFKKRIKKNSILYVPSDILLKDYLKYDEYFDLRKYSLDKKFLTNLDINKKEKVFLVDKNIEKLDFSAKVEKFKKTNSNISKLLVFNLDQIAYLTNLRSFQMNFSSLFESILYLDLKNSNHILFLNEIPKDIKIENLKFLKLSQYSDFIQSIDDEISLEISDITLENYLSIQKPKELKSCNLSILSSIKPLSVIEDLKNSFKKTDKAILKFKKRLKIGLSELDLVKIFEEELLKAGAKHPSFKTILAIDENSASIHYSSYDKNKTLKEESLLLLDCGGYYDSGYATDITRTFYFGKNPKEIYKKIYTKTLKAFVNCFLSKEVNAGSVDKVARDILFENQKDGFYFNHGLGHGIGTSVHQNPPRLSLKSLDTIRPFQVHSIEPGLYGKTSDGIEFGVRIENCVYFDLEYKRVSLSKFPFEEILIDYSLLNDIEVEFVKKWQEEFNGLNWNYKHAEWFS